MRHFLICGAVALGMSAMSAAPAAAHPDNEVKAPGKCDPITPWQWGKVRKGMTLDQIEKLVGCHASHSSTNHFNSDTVDNYFFKTGGKSLAEIKIKNGKLWQKYGYHSGL